MQNKDLECLLHDKSSQYLMLYGIRIFTLSLALLASLFIIITCVFSKQTKYWIIKLLIAQSTAESVVLITNLIVSYQSDCWKITCWIIGYFRYCFWFSSLSCSFLMIYANYKYIQDTQYLLKIDNKYIIQRIYVAFIWPFFWLAIPFGFKQFGPGGWELYKTQEVFHVFCGFSNDSNSELFNLIFWSIPLLILLLASFYFSRKNKQALIHNFQDEILIPKEFQIGLQIYPKIYLIAWTIQIIIRQIERIQIISMSIKNNIYLYIPYSGLLIGFNLHICIACYYFVKNYKFQTSYYLDVSLISIKPGNPL